MINEGMEQVNIPYYPITVNLDTDPNKLKPTEAHFLKGTRIKISRNAVSGVTGGTDQMITPIQSNVIFCEGFELPEGHNVVIGAYEFRELNEIYWFVWNEFGNHTVNMIDGATETCTIVFQGECLNFSLAPENAIPEQNNYIRVQYDEADGIRVVKEKFLIFTDAYNDVRQINVLASIGSDSFSSSYFAPVYPYNECCESITLAPIAPMYRPNWELVPRVEGSDETPVNDGIPNKLFNRAIQLAYQFVYVDGRQSTISPYGAPIIVGGTDCFEQNPDVLPRCADVQLWVGNAFVDKINIYFRECTTCVTGACNENWFLYDTIDKHNCDENVKWWLRTNAWDEYSYDAATNEITYTFCANKECTPVDQAIFNHIENEVPFKSNALTSLGDRIGLANNLRGSENLTCEQRDSLAITVTPQPDETCTIPKRTITVYMIIRNDSEVDGYGHECEFLWGDSSGGSNSPIDGRYYFGGFGWRKYPVPPSTKKVAVDNFWKEYNQYVPAIINDETGGFVGYLAGTSFTSVSSQVKLTLSDCNIEDIGIIYGDKNNLTKKNGSFDTTVEALKDGEYLILQKFVFEDVPAGAYSFRVAGHRTGMDLGYEQTSTYVYQTETNDNCATGGDYTPAISKDYELIINTCDYDYDSLQEGIFVKLLDLTLPDFEGDARNVIDYNFVREFYLFEDSDYSIPFEQQQIGFDFGKFHDPILGDILVDGFEDESSGLPVYLIDPWTLNILGIGVPIPCPPTPAAPFAGQLDTPSGVYNTTLRKTDHNGFGFHREHFWRWRTFYNVTPCSLFEMTAQFGEPTLGTLSIDYVNGCSVSSMDIAVGKSKVSPPVTALNNKGYKGLLGTVSKSTGTSDDACNRIHIEGHIFDLDGNRLAGINVGYSQSQFVRTDGFGKFNLVVHQNTSFGREDYFMISNAGFGCQIVCNENCETCCDDMFEEIVLPTCSSDEEDCPELTLDRGNYYFKKVNFPDKGLKGRYGIGVCGWDCYGRVVTGAVNNIGYIDVTDCWSKHPIISWAWDGTNMPDEVKYLTFFRTHNLNGTILQWVADKFILIDANGNETNSKGKAVAVAVDMSSLLEYNVQNNFNSLVNYGFVQGDIIKILDDCENPIQYIITGTTFGTTQTTAIQQELQVVTNGTTATATTNVASSNGGRIIIPYDSRLDDIIDKCAVKIEITRPYECAENLTPYCEISDVVIVKNGVLQTTSGILNTWDTYKIFRTIPSQAGCSNNPSDDPFFSNNITDFWGENCNDCGRKFSENPYAQRRWNQNELAVSKAWVNNGVINGLSSFWGEDVKNFKTQNFGGIVAMDTQRGMIFYICENDYFVTAFDQNFLTLSESGVVQATAQDKISEPTQKVGMNFGCRYEDKSTIVFFNGTAYWLDARNAAYVRSNYSQAEDISLNIFKGWLVDKTRFVQNYNESISGDADYLQKMYEFVGGICPLHKEVHLTVRRRGGLSQNDEFYVNEQRQIITDMNETIVWGHEANTLLNLRPYTAEYYGKLRSSKSGIQFIAFKGGRPYKHNGDTGNTYGVFFGVPTTPVIEISANLTDSKVKIFQSLSEEIQPFPLYVDRIITDEPNSYSVVPPLYFKKKENIQYSEVLRDMSSYFDPNKYQVSMLIDGKRIFGRYALIRFVATSGNEQSYFELNRIWSLVSGSELSMKPQVASSGG